MQASWLIKNNSKKLIVFFNGWSMDENAVKHLSTSQHDVVMLYNYSDLEIPESIINESNGYEEINIIAWSFGVWSAAAVINQFKNPKNIVAINGTLIPIDNSFGIKEKIFNLTLFLLSSTTYASFFKNMFSSIDEYEKSLNSIPKREIEDKKNELSQIKKLTSEQNVSEEINRFTKIIIGLN